MDLHSDENQIHVSLRTGLFSGATNITKLTASEDSISQQALPSNLATGE